jgi:glycosyl transferase family 87
VAAVALFVTGVALMLVPPAGCNALPLAVACLWRWPPTVQDWLNARLRLDRRALDVTGVVLAVAAAGVSLATGGQLDGHLLHGGDFQSYWLGATVGERYGWQRLFDLALQQRLWPELAGSTNLFLPFLNTPPTAWLAALLLGLPYVAAYAVWVAFLVLAAAGVVVLVVPRAWLLPATVVAAGLWITPQTLASGQNAVLEALAVVVTWRLLRSGHEVWAGLALSVVFLRPTATFLVPLALFLAGYRRTFVVWLAATAALVAASVWSLGTSGINDFIHLAIDIRRSHPRAIDMTILGWLGQNPATILLELVLTAAALWAARRGGREPATAIALGVLASLFATPYIHHQDWLTVIAVATAVALTLGPWYGLILIAVLGVAPPGWIFGGQWEGALVLVEVAWLGWMAANRMPSQTRPTMRFQT